MTRIQRIVGAAAVSGVIATAGLAAGTGQANATPVNTRHAVSTAADLTTGVFNKWLCEKFRWTPPVCPPRR